MTKWRAHRVVFRLLAWGLLVGITSFPSYARSAPINPFDVLVDRIAIHTTAGVPTEITRRLSSLRFPTTPTISVSTRGELELYAYILFTSGVMYQAAPCTDNPFKPLDQWVVDFFEIRNGDRLVPYSTVNQSAKTLRFTAYGAVSGTHDVRQLIFGCAPVGDVKAGNLNRAHVVVINYVK